MKKAIVIFIILCLTILSTANVNAFENSFEENIPTGISDMDVSNMTFEERMDILRSLHEYTEEMRNNQLLEYEYSEEAYPSQQENSLQESEFTPATTISSDEDEEFDYSLKLEGDANLLWSYETTEYDDMEPFDDANKDGTFDALMYNKNNIILLSGEDGSTIWKKECSIKRINPLYNDLNADGITELIIVSAESDSNNQGTVFVMVINGANGDVINDNSFTVSANPEATEYELNVELKYGTEDITDDNVHDVFLEITQSYRIYIENDNYPTYFEDNKLIAIDPTTGLEIWEKSISDSGQYILLNYDYTGDKVKDILFEHAQKLYILNGSDGSIVFNHSISGYNIDFEYVDGLDVDGDKISDIVIGESSISEYNSSLNREIYSNRIVALKGTNGIEIWEKNIQMKIGYALLFIHLDTTSTTMELKIW